MKRNWKTLVICVLIPLAVGTVAGFLTRGGMESFALLNKPPLSPPAWVFPLVWTVLYILMGEAAYRVLTSGADKTQIRQALIAYGVQ